MRKVMAVCIALLLPSAAIADDFTPSIDEVSGNWIAMSFSDGPETKVCGVGSTDHKIFFRADANDIEVRSSNTSWSLSADATGDMTVKVGDVVRTFGVQTLDSTTLAGIVKADDLKDLFNAMDKAPSASLAFGTKKPVLVSLSGSTGAINSFRTCAATHGFGDLGGSAGPSASPF